MYGGIKMSRQKNPNDPKEYWRILNGSKKGENHVAVKEFYKYFKNLNNPPNYSVASDLGLHCLLMSILLDARHRWVN